MDIGIETITPESAARYLTVNEGNRNLRSVRVSAYAEAMRRGAWHMTGDPVVFDWHGRLIQGQHRLAACIAADTPFTTAVARGADPAVYGVLDSGLTRSAADAIAHSIGAAQPANLAAVGRYVLAWRIGVVNNSNAVEAKILRDDVVEFVGKNVDELTFAVKTAGRINRAIGGNKTAYGAFVFEVRSRGRAEELDLFFDAVIDGVGLEPGDARLAFRNWVAANRRTTGANERVVALMNLVRAWNHWLNGQSIAHIRSWKRGLPPVELIA